MKVLAVAPEPFFTPRGTPFSVYYRTRVMGERGAVVDLLTYGEGQDVELPNGRLVRIPRLRFLEPVKTGPSVAKALLDGIMVLWTVGLLARHRYDVVHAHEEAVFWCRLLKPLFRFKLIYDMHSSLPQQLCNFSYSQSRMLVKAFERLEAKSLERSDAIVTICPSLRDQVVNHNGTAKRQVMIENSLCEPVRVKGEARCKSEAPHTLANHAEDTVPSSPLVLYTGTLEPYQGIDLLLASMPRLLKLHSTVTLMLVGGTQAQVERYRDKAESMGVGGYVRFTGRVEQQHARPYRQATDVLVSPRAQGTNTPLKIYEMLASGRPIVATAIEAHTQVLTNEVCFLAEPEASALADAMSRALTDRPEARQRAENARQLYERAYARSAYEKKIDQMMDLVR